MESRHSHLLEVPGVWLYPNGYTTEVLVPKGHLRIAQRFSVGSTARAPSPEGTAELQSHK